MSKKEKFKAGWAFGALAIAIILLIIGRLTSEELRDTSPASDDVQIDVDQIESNSDTSINTTNENQTDSTTGPTFELNAPTNAEPTN